METEDINVIWLNQFQSKQNTDSNPTGTKWQWLLTEECCEFQEADGVN